MVRQRPRSEVVVTVGALALISIAFLKPWGSTPTTSDVRPTARTPAVDGPTATVPASSPPVGAAGTVVATISVSDVPLAPVAVGDALWYPAHGPRLMRVDAVTSAATDVGLDAGRFPGAFALTTDGVDLYIAATDDGSVARFDPSGQTIVEQIPVPVSDPAMIDHVDDATNDGGFLWFVASDVAGSTMLYRVELPAEMHQVHALDGPVSIGAGFGWVWILSQPSGSDSPTIVDRLDPEKGDVMARIGLPSAAIGTSRCSACIMSLDVGTNSVWVPTGPGMTLMRIDPWTDQVVAMIDLQGVADAVVEAPDGYIWVTGGGPTDAGCDPAAGFVAVIDPSTNRIVGRGHVPCPVSVAALGPDIWVGTDGPDGPSVWRIAPTN